MSVHKPSSQKLFELLRFYAIHDAAVTQLGLTQWAEAVLAAGFTTLQVRDKLRVQPEDALRIVVRRARRAGACVIVNDWVDLAERVDADGVHLGEADADPGQVRHNHRDWIIGASARTVERAILMLHAGVDYLGVGPIYATQTKQGLPEPIGWAGFDAVAESTPLPCIGIGGLGAACLEQESRRSERAIGLAFCGAVGTREGIARMAQAIERCR